MEGIYKHYIIDMSCNNNFVQIPTMQGDGNEVRGAIIELIANNVQYVVDPAKTIISIGGIKPDTSDILNKCKVTEEGYILVDITSQMAAVPGRGDYQIVLIDRETKAQLTSFPFYILTTASFNAKNIVSSNEFQLLTENIVKSEKTVEDAEEIISTLTELEEKVSDAEQEREAAELTRQTNTTLAIENIEKATENAITVTTSANAATAKLNNALAASNAATEATNKAIEDAKTATSSANIAIEDIRELETDITTAEAIRVKNENNRKKAESTRVTSEATRENNEATRQDALANMLEATENTVIATTRANTISEDLEYKVATGYYKGEKGNDGVIYTVDSWFAFQLEGDNLVLYYQDDQLPPSFYINSDGELVYEITDTSSVKAMQTASTGDIDSLFDKN